MPSISKVSIEMPKKKGGKYPGNPVKGGEDYPGMEEMANDEDPLMDYEDDVILASLQARPDLMGKLREMFTPAEAEEEMVEGAEDAMMGME